MIIFNTKLSLRLSNAVGLIKIVTLILWVYFCYRIIPIADLSSVSALQVLWFLAAEPKSSIRTPTSITHLKVLLVMAMVFPMHLSRSTSHTRGTPMLSMLSTKLRYIYNILHENLSLISQNPIRVLKKTAPVSLIVVATLYMLVNIAYFAAGTPFCHSCHGSEFD